MLEHSRPIIEEKREIFEKYKVMTELISSIQKEKVKTPYDIEEDDIEEDPDEEIETTSHFDIQQFNSWVRNQASKDLLQFKNLMNICDLSELRSKICSLNCQQRKLFDDVVERLASFNIDEKSFYLFLSGNAGTGKSYLLKLIIDAVKVVKAKAFDDLMKPSLIVMAPTATAAFIIKGKTIDSVLGFLPGDANTYSRPSASKLATMKYTFEDVSLIICDEASMVGCNKLLKINYRLQEFFDGARSKQYMGGIPFIASGRNLLFQH